MAKVFVQVIANTAGDDDDIINSTLFLTTEIDTEAEHRRLLHFAWAQHRFQ